MAKTGVTEAIQRFRRGLLVQDGPESNDAQLLGCFIEHRDEAAFAALVRRHGPMVLGVCQRVLRNHYDAEDAFQATFLVLVRKAAVIASRELLANWLYRVAYQTALKARAVAGKRRRRETQMPEMPEPEAPPQDLWSDLRSLLDQELSGLPTKYRVPILLCDLKGHSRTEAARQLGWPEGTLSGRLARAREMLARRLARRGFVVTAGTLAGLFARQAASACVPTPLAVSTIRAATSLVTGETVIGQTAAAGAISFKVAALTEGVLRAMLMTKLKIVAMVLLLTGLIAVGGGLFAYQTAAAERSKAETPAGKGKRGDTDAPKPDAPKPDAPKPDATKPDATKPDATKPDATKVDKEKLQGLWQIESMEGDGMKVSSDDLAAVDGAQRRIRIDDDKWITTNAQGNEESRAFRLDATKTPRAINIKALDGSFDQLGIYRLDGDDLKICFCGGEKQERPTEFATQKGSPMMLIVYKRVAAKQADQPLEGGWKLEHTMRHEAIINGVAFSKDVCASWGEDGYIRLWNLKTGKAGAKLRSHPKHEPVKFAYFLPDGKHVFSISGNGALTIWEFGTEPAHGKVFTITNVVLGLGRDRQSLAVVLQDAIVIQRLKLPEFSFVPQGRDFVASVTGAKPMCTSFTAEGDLLAVGFDNGTVGLWNTSNQNELWSHTHHTGDVRAMSLSPDDKLLATAGKDGTILLWELSGGTVKARLKGERGEVRTVAFSHDGKLLVSGGEDKTARVWDIATQRETARLTDHVGAVTAAAFDGERTRIITGSTDGSVRVWQLQRKGTKTP
jgi:RNA polymerase sigma factor (sigma-70 family)